MAIKSLMIPILTGGAIAMGALVVSNVRRAVTLRARSGARRPRVESDPIGIGDEDDLTPEPVTPVKVRTEPVKVRTEAEATAVAGAGWPLRSLASVEPVPGRDEETPRSMSEPLLDFDIDFEDLESSGVSSRGDEANAMAEQYDAVDPDSLASQWLLRATETSGPFEPLDDIAELPTEPNPLMSEASIRAAEFNDDEEEMAPTRPGSYFNREVDEGAPEVEEEAVDPSVWDSTSPADSSKK